MKTMRTIGILSLAVIAAFWIAGCKRTINPALTDAFVKASYEGKLDDVKKLYDQGADLDAESAANYGNTPLMTAANSGKIDVMEFLLKKGADVNRKNSSGYNALGNALTGGRVDSVKLLIARGVNVNDPAGYGKTQLARVEEWEKDYPANATWKELVEILKKAGAK